MKQNKTSADMKGTKPLQQQTTFKSIHWVTNYYALSSLIAPVSTQKQKALDSEQISNLCTDLARRQDKPKCSDVIRNLHYKQ